MGDAAYNFITEWSFDDLFLLNKIFKKCRSKDFHTCYECGQMISPLEKHYKKLKKEFAGYFICKPCVVDVISERVLLADE